MGEQRGVCSRPLKVVIDGKLYGGGLTHRFAPWGQLGGGTWGVPVVAAVLGSPWGHSTLCQGSQRHTGGH